MTLLGKIFTVLVFIMSIFFMALAVSVYATHRNWRDIVLAEEAKAGQPLGLVKQLSQREERIATLEKEKSELQQKTDVERAARRQALAALEAQLQQLQVALDNKTQEHVALVDAHRAAVTAVETAQKNLTFTRGEVVDLRTAQVDTQRERDELFGRAVALTETLHDAKGSEARLRERNQQLAQDVAQTAKVLDAVKPGATKDTDISGIPPELEGVVLAVSKQGNVEVSIGSDDGLQEGHEMDISRAGSYVGRIVIRRAAPDRAVGTMTGTPRSQVQKGDRVRTKVD